MTIKPRTISNYQPSTRKTDSNKKAHRIQKPTFQISPPNRRDLAGQSNGNVDGIGGSPKQSKGTIKINYT